MAIDVTDSLADKLNGTVDVCVHKCVCVLGINQKVYI